MLLADHRPAGSAIQIWTVDDLETAEAEMREQGLRGRRPHRRDPRRQPPGAQRRQRQRDRAAAPGSPLNALTRTRVRPGRNNPHPIAGQRPIVLSRGPAPGTQPDNRGDTTGQRRSRPRAQRKPGASTCPNSRSDNTSLRRGLPGQRADASSGALEYAGFQVSTAGSGVIMDLLLRDGVIPTSSFST